MLPCSNPFEAIQFDEIDPRRLYCKVHFITSDTINDRISDEITVTVHRSIDDGGDRQAVRQETIEQALDHIKVPM